MFLLSCYPLAKIAAIIATLCSAQLYKKYTQLTFNQQDFILNMPVKDAKQAKQAKQAVDLINVFTQANTVIELLSNNKLSKPEQNQPFENYLTKNKTVLNSSGNIILNDIDPLIKDYTQKYAYPTKKELIKAIFENQ